MKKLLLIACILVASITSCTDEHYITEEHYYVGSEVVSKTYEIRQSYWEWNNVYHRYEYIIQDIKELDEDIYERGSIIGTVFINEEYANGETYEVQKTLPFVQTYRDLAVPYTETISFDIFYGAISSSVTFYIQSSDGSPNTPFLGTYTFKVTYVRDSGK